MGGVDEALALCLAGTLAAECEKLRDRLAMYEGGADLPEINPRYGEGQRHRRHRREDEEPAPFVVRTPLQRRIAEALERWPRATNAVIAAEAGCTPNTVAVQRRRTPLLEKHV